MTATLDATATTRRVTPTGTLVLPSTATRDEWLNARRDGITATDIVKIVGASKYGSALDVYADKLDQAFPEDPLSEAGEWGVVLEDFVARRWAEMRGVTVRRIGLVANATTPWMLASLDRTVHGCDTGARCGAEIKTTTAWLADDWTDGVPERVDVQVQWQLAVSGLDHMHVAALIGGQHLVEHTVHPNPIRQTRLIAAGGQVWDAVKAQTPPDIDPETITVDLLARIYPNRDGDKVVNGDLVRGLLRDYVEAGEGEAAFKETKDRIKTELLVLLGDGEVAVDEHGTPLFTYKAQTSRRVDYKVLEAEHPDVYAEVVTTSPSRVFRPAKSGR